MTERECFEKNIDIIAEIAIECRKMDREEYEKLKSDWFKAVPDKSKPFIAKVFKVIDEVIRK